ncbi:chromosome partitioning protein ParA [Rodentibacter caecimuris]|uniref:Chromosome partitioning protein ParA n=1 Tax=Rodentibacter caecimuris TaxID=1796644 RepID=A0AAJ3K2V3_9PAST|nr:Chromosome partitioning ATPase in PFGI-1-like cluster, ParA-like [Pasteurellaceae bacterium NI1060]MCQ9124147.1 ParA family protein [Rodentibacter heylii]OOF71752.1 chromosome partitioning protein ParA [Rodentibacter heylii]OOF73937.1 chromosome partitioning protein ParA [Rodentibacter heylii]OOF77129.1 chromosome partitioning protein ParA [Rodentibacter heylii]
MKNQTASQKPFIITIASTKSGSAKSTNAANIGAFCADHGLKTLLIDTDIQPTLSAYFALEYAAPGGIYEFLINQDVDPANIISKTTLPNLDLIQSNDPTNNVSQMLRNAPDGAIRFSFLLKKLQGYDVIIVDISGTRDITVDMSVLAADLLFCPILPHILSAKEFIRCTIGMYQELQTFEAFGFQLPPLKAVPNCVDHTNDVKFVLEHLYQLFRYYVAVAQRPLN